jgi:tRNA dimethylallyltransferase
MTIARDPQDIAPLCLVGPTASGKSTAAMAIAEVLPVEIVSVDSAQVYRGMDIGTAKPSPAERERVVHHLIDIREPEQAYSAAEFARDARRLVGEIRARGHLPLFVGGTMLYLLAWFDALDPLPAADPAIRARLDRLAAERGWPALHADLARLDPVTAARLAPSDAQRVQRALEVIELTGKPLSAQQRTAWSGGLEPRWPMISLEPNHRDWLHRRIEQRLDTMIESGFVGEVQALMARSSLSAAHPSMRAVGYRQAWAVLADPPAGADEAGRKALIRALAQSATRQLAKRQLTWLRRFAAREIVACDQQRVVAEVVDRAVAHWRRTPGRRTP